MEVFFRLVFHKKVNDLYLGGTWYVVYYSNYETDKYLRIGKLVIKQDYDQVNIERLTSHTPKISGGAIVKGEYKDCELTERPSTGHGFAKINIENRTFTGVYFVTRASQHTVTGLLNCQINDVNHEMAGAYTTTETHRSDNRPVGGKVMFFRDEKNQIAFCNKLINKTEK